MLRVTIPDALAKVALQSATELLGRCEMANAGNQVKPDYGPQPKGKANIMRQGQTEVGAWGEDPMVMGKIPEVRDSPDL